jgi:hypothetical protein
MKWSHLVAILLGVVLIAAIAPLAQFLTVLTVNADIETATPIGWAVGLVFSMVLALAAVRLIARSHVLDKAHLVIVYSMLTIAVPLMNLGLVRQSFTSMMSAINEYMHHGTSTYRTIYNALPRHWFPVVPTEEGLPWNKAERLLNLLQDKKTIRSRDNARKALVDAILAEHERLLTETATAPVPAAETRRLLALVENLGVREVETIQKEVEKIEGAKEARLLERLGLAAPLARQLGKKKAQSAAAAAKLPDLLEDVDELEVSLVPDILAAMDKSSRDRYEREMKRLEGEGKLEGILRRRDALAPRLSALKADVTRLSPSDATKVRSDLVDRLMERYAELSDEEVNAVRFSFVYRLKEGERDELLKQGGKEGTPNQNFWGFQKSLWSERKQQQVKQRQGWWENVRQVWREAPWHLWVMPMVMWFLLFATVFMFLMCLGEWLRRKWIERENLAFPLVEVADHIIRHDHGLEMAESVEDPPRRRWPFNPVFLVGFGAGALYISLDALYHYGLAGRDYGVYFNVSESFFTTGEFKEMDKVFLVISPIVLGIAFLVSLEISFSVWVLFFLYSFVALIGKLSIPDNVRKDSLFTGWAAGKLYPFPAEQMVGACVCFAAILLYKSWRTKTHHGPGIAENDFIPRRLNLVGLIVLPIAIFALLWNLGVTNVTLLALVSVLVMAQTIAAARVRAETGLHTHHVSYEFTKAPIVFGMTGHTGARAYAMFITVAFLPITLLFRTLPQHLENMELARRYRLRLRTIAVAALTAFVAALVVGMVSFVVFSYYMGEDFYAGETGRNFSGQGESSFNIARYSLWVSHYMGEKGLSEWTQVHWIRVWFMLIGFGVFGLLSFLRGRFLRFPFHPIAYVLLLFSIYYAWISPYYKGEGTKGQEAIWIWGSVLLAWLLKKLIIKYGGMNTYKKAKPFFIGLVVGSVVCIFAWNMTDLVCSIVGKFAEKPGSFVKPFLEHQPYSPRFY